MPFQPEHSLLRVEVPALHTIDTSSVENLFGVWSLFAKTSHAMESGKRLENLSWRVWNRETFCCAPARKRRSSSRTRASITSATGVAPADMSVPALSSSLSSNSTIDSEHEDTESLIQSTTFGAQSAFESLLGATSRGREKHITPIDLQNFVQSIRESPGIQPIDFDIPMPVEIAPKQEVIAVAPAEEATSDRGVMVSNSSTLEESSSTVGTTTTSENKSSPSQSFGSDDSTSTETSKHSIVRGFVPGGAPSSYRSQTNLAAQPTPILKKANHTQVPSKKKGPMFTIGTSSGEEESSLESHMYTSSLSQSLRRSPAKGPIGSSNMKKQTSFREEPTIARDSPVFESDDEDDEGVSESAIEDDDDSSDWEDSDDQSGPSSVNEKDLFQRVDSRPNLTSRRSLLTTLMHEPDRARALTEAASRSTPALRRSRVTTPNGPSIAASPEAGAPTVLPPFGQNVTSQPSDAARSRPIAMMAGGTHPHQQLALSPRTTRRNMLSTELTESLRKNLLWERQHRSTGNLAALKRRHTSHDVKNLKQHPEAAPVMSQGGQNFTNDFFHAGLQEYHAQGW